MYDATMILEMNDEEIHRLPTQLVASLNNRSLNINVRIKPINLIMISGDVTMRNINL